MQVYQFETFTMDPLRGISFMVHSTDNFRREEWITRLMRSRITFHDAFQKINHTDSSRSYAIFSSCIREILIQLNSEGNAHIDVFVTIFWHYFIFQSVKILVLLIETGIILKKSKSKVTSTIFFILHFSFFSSLHFYRRLTHFSDNLADTNMIFS